MTHRPLRRAPRRLDNPRRVVVAFFLSLKRLSSRTLRLARSACNFLMCIYMQLTSVDTVSLKSKKKDSAAPAPAVINAPPLTPADASATNTFGAVDQGVIDV